MRHFVYGLPSTVPFRRVGDTDLWYVTVEIPPGSRVEYKLEVVNGGRGEWIRDPLNPREARDPSARTRWRWARATRRRRGSSPIRRRGRARWRI
ncbi:MAG: hypothetical protein H6705_12420 [Myxococcales bacterium]|nr:hypothetical protein [Myxococcales bacterium]